MSAHDRVRWDEIYRQQADYAYPAPDPLLFDYTPAVPPGKTQRAVDLAAGFGQNGLWLAEQGYVVDLIDISREALMRARAEMTMRNLRTVNLLQEDLDDIDLEEEIYHLVAVFRYLKRDLLTKLKASVIPGGRVIYQSFTTVYLETVPDFNPAFLLHPGELRTLFDDWKVIHYSEMDHEAQLVARKPGEMW
jgi:SAM-dependent methyltransferase